MFSGARRFIVMCTKVISKKLVRVSVLQASTRLETIGSLIAHASVQRFRLSESSLAPDLSACSSGFIGGTACKICSLPVILCELHYLCSLNNK